MKLAKLADVATSLTMEAMGGIIDAFDERIADVRKHQGMYDTSYNVRAILEGSKNITRQGDLRVQDAYSLRCVPQIHCASKDTLNYVKSKVDI